MSYEPVIGQCEAGAIHVMSFNLRHGGIRDPWVVRHPFQMQILKAERPTLLATQEAVHPRILSLCEGLPNLGWVGTGRRGAGKGEYAAIFYDKRRLVLEDWRTFWLSSTPWIVGSRSYGNRLPRIATWARFREAASERGFTVVNTHLDHESAESRISSVRLIGRWIHAFHEDDPLIVAGDFNAAADVSEEFRSLVDGLNLIDTWEATRSRIPSMVMGTRHGYGMIEGYGERIDWILASSHFKIFRAALNPARVAGRWSSDHCAVHAVLRFDTL